MHSIELILVNGGKMPVKGSRQSAGYDLFSNEKIVVEPHSRKCVGTGVKLKMLDQGFYIRIAPRSGLAVKKSIDIGAGVVDSDYRGEMKVVLVNNGDVEFCVDVGDKIAQFIVEKYEPDTLIKCYNNDGDEVAREKLCTFDRGEGGFGSTGLK
jgi:dUTP pyrophosphatase|tara:strand:- start:36 stop:494 length:459 start_codon:yes stop_codon:yes gene_type:complete